MSDERNSNIHRHVRMHLRLLRMWMRSIFSEVFFVKEDQERLESYRGQLKKELAVVVECIEKLKKK